jgi:hypothetical protein
LRLIRALAVEIHEDWDRGPPLLNMELLRERRKQLELNRNRLLCFLELIGRNPRGRQIAIVDLVLGNSITTVLVTINGEGETLAHPPS